MSEHRVLQDIRAALDGRPGQPIALGVCVAIARRLHSQAWGVRLVAIVIGLFWAMPALAAYVVAGLLLPETASRSRRFFAGLAVVAREWAERLFGALGGGDPGRRSARPESYGR